jgi:long-chain fatty acid transport protein
VNEKMAFGFGINNPFGLQTDWDKNFSSVRYIATFSKVLTTAFNPNIAYQVTNNLSMAVGIDYVHLRATLEKTTPNPFSPLTDTNFRLSGDGEGLGVNAALKYKASDAINIGFSYRSRIKVDLEGTAEILGTPLSGTGNTSLTLPDLIQLGVSYHASDKLILNADIDYTMWSTYDRIVIESNVSAFNNQTDEKQWDNVWCLRIGGQYKLSDQWKLRAGYLYDKNPIGETHFEARTPDSDRQGITIGTGYQAGNITLDLAYLYLRFKDRTISNSVEDDFSETPKAPNALNGTYKSQAHLAGITVGYKF